MTDKYIEYNIDIRNYKNIQYDTIYNIYLSSCHCCTISTDMEDTISIDGVEECVISLVKNIEEYLNEECK